MRPTPPTRGACSPSRPRETSVGYSNPRSPGFRGVPSGRGVPARSIADPHGRGNPPTPAYPRSVRRMRSKRVRAPEAASEARHDAAATDHSARTAGNAHASGRGGADARAETPSAARLRSASRVPASLDASRGRFRAATFNGLKGPRPAFKATLDRSRARGLPPRFFFRDEKGVARFFFLFSCFSRTHRDRGTVDSAVARATDET